MSEPVTTIPYREKMKTVLKVWTEKQTIYEAADYHGTSIKEIEDWCKIAMRGAKLELEKIS